MVHPFVPYSILRANTPCEDRHHRRMSPSHDFELERVTGRLRSPLFPSTALKPNCPGMDDEFFASVLKKWAYASQEVVNLKKRLGEVEAEVCVTHFGSH